MDLISLLIIVAFGVIVLFFGMHGSGQFIAQVGYVSLVEGDQLDTNGFTLIVDVFLKSQSYFVESGSNPSADFVAGMAFHLQSKNYDTRVDNDTVLIELIEDKLAGNLGNMFAYHVDDHSPEYLLANITEAGDWASLTVEQNRILKKDEDINLNVNYSDFGDNPTTVQLKVTSAMEEEVICWK